MSQAFYPTNDGHIGNLRKLSTIEIKDLLKRQEDLLNKKKSLLNKLPDKGAKIKKHLEEFRQELNRREAEAKSTERLTLVGKNGQKTGQSFENNHEDVRESGGGLSDNTLENELHRLSVKDEKCEVDQNTGSEGESLEKHKHQFEVALERAEKNIQSGLKQPIKLNRALKIENIKDLPEDIKKTKDSLRLPDDINYQNKMEHSQSKVNEESSAVPPHYKYSEVKMIDINESLQLQIQQKQIQEELNAQLAAEKLAERLHIKMDEYNPEGTDMSYRGSKIIGFNDDIDSDDDDDDEDVDNARYSKTMLPSDTED